MSKRKRELDTNGLDEKRRGLVSPSQETEKFSSTNKKPGNFIYYSLKMDFSDKSLQHWESDASVADSSSSC